NREARGKGRPSSGVEGQGLEAPNVKRDAPPAQMCRRGPRSEGRDGAPIAAATQRGRSGRTASAGLSEVQEELREQKGPVALRDEQIALVRALEPRRLVRMAIRFDPRDRGERRLEARVVPRHEHPVAGVVPPDMDVPAFE